MNNKIKEIKEVKRAYVKPRIQTIDLAADEVMAGTGCKNVSISGAPGITPATCVAALGSPCNALAS